MGTHSIKANKARRLAAAVFAAVLSASMLGAGISDDDNAGNAVIFTSAAEAGDSAEQSEYERQLSEIEKKQKELDARIAAAGSDIAGRQEKLDAIRKKAASIKKKIDKVTAKADKTEDEMCELDAQMRETRYKLGESEAAVAQGLSSYKDRLRAIYVAGNDSYSEVIINADSFYDVLMRVELIKRVTERDNAAIGKLVEQKNSVQEMNDALTEQSKGLKKKSRQYAEERSRLLAEEAELIALCEEYGGDIEELKTDLSDYTDQAELLSGEHSKVKAEAEAAKTTKAAETTASKKSSKKKTAATEPDAFVEEAPVTNVKKRRNAAKTTTNKKTTTTTTTTAEIYTEPEIETEPEQFIFDEPETKTEPVTTTATTTTVMETEPQFQEIEYEEPAAEQLPQTQTQPETSAPAAVSGTLDSVINYAKGMVGGSYVWAGEQYGATDCSGLVMLSYKQIGIDLPHYAASQAEYGTNVSMSEIQPGDLVFFGGSSYSSIYHVAMYIGDGKIVHAESTDTGIVISYLDSMAQYNNVTCIKRLV